MDGRIPAGIVTLVVPTALLGVTIEDFSANPIAILVELAVMFGGALYLLTYSDAF